MCSTVQEALTIQKQCCTQHIPEKFMTYKKNTASQKKIIYAVDLCTNNNVEVFILDAGAACIRVIDRSTVAAVNIIGKIGPYPRNGKMQ